MGVRGPRWDDIFESEANFTFQPKQHKVKLGRGGTHCISYSKVCFVRLCQYLCTFQNGRLAIPGTIVWVGDNDLGEVGLENPRMISNWAGFGASDGKEAPHARDRGSVPVPVLGLQTGTSTI